MGRAAAHLTSTTNLSLPICVDNRCNRSRENLASGKSHEVTMTCDVTAQ